MRKILHSFPFIKLQATNPPFVMSTVNLIRVTVCARRNPKLTEDEFNDHWANKHGPLITSWLQKHNCVKYVQVRVPKSSFDVLDILHTES